MISRLSLTIAASTVIGVLAGTVQAQVPWVPSAGSGSFFTYANGLSQNGLFGNPTLVGDQFTFTPTNFVANSVNGVAASVPDLLQVDITANPGHRLTMIRITEFGSWGITGIGGQVRAFGSLNLVDLINVRGPAIAPLVAGATSPAVAPMPIITPGSGLWAGSVVIDLTTIIGPDWTKLRLSFTNTLQASSAVGGSAFIDKKIVAGPSIIVEIFPTPGSATMLALGGLMVARRRRPR